MSILSIALLCFGFVHSIAAHGFLTDPPARSSAWLYDRDFERCCTNYDHAAMSCGGFNRQWAGNKGKCSICGEPYDLKKKAFGMGDTKYLGKIVRSYQQGSVIQVTVKLTSNHLGSFEFRLCSLDPTPNQDATQECLDSNQLKIESALMRYPIRPTHRSVRLSVHLPGHVTCKHCVLQWKYRTGNSWGSTNGRACLGCGRENEEFYGCADVAIQPKIRPGGGINRVAVEMKSPVTPRNCTLAATFSRFFDLSSVMRQYCETICANDCSTDKTDGNTSIRQSCQNTCAKLCHCK